MRAATPQTLSWLRAVVHRELQATTFPPTPTTAPRTPPHLRIRSSPATSAHPIRALSTSPARLQGSQPSTSTSTPTDAAPTPTSTPPQQQQQDPQRQQQYTHYSLFPKTLPHGPPPAGPFAIDLRALRNEFLQLQAAAHPDRVQHAAAADKRRQDGVSARINEAYKTLQNPLLRAQHLLQLRGVDVAADETLKVEDPELLMEVLEMRERIEEAESEGEVQAMREENEARIAESVGVLDEAFRVDDVERAKVEAVKLRYWVNIRESLDAWEPGKPVVLEH